MTEAYKIPEQIFCPASGEVCNFATMQRGHGVIDLCKGGILAGQSRVPPVISENENGEPRIEINIYGKAEIFCGAEIAMQCLRETLVDSFINENNTALPFDRQDELAMAVEFFAETNEINYDSVALCATREISDGNRELFSKEIEVE